MDVIVITDIQQKPTANSLMNLSSTHLAKLVEKLVQFGDDECAGRITVTIYAGNNPNNCTAMASESKVAFYTSLLVLYHYVIWESTVPCPTLLGDARTLAPSTAL